MLSGCWDVFFEGQTFCSIRQALIYISLIYNTTLLKTHAVEQKKCSAVACSSMFNISFAVKQEVNILHLIDLY